MKNLFLSLLLIAMACNEYPKNETASVTNTFNEEAEKTAIMKTIKDETEAFYKRNYEAWKQHFYSCRLCLSGMEQ